MPNTQPVLSTIGVITESGDPTLDIETAAQLIDSRLVAERAARSLGDGTSATELLEAISVEPIRQSNVVNVTAEGPSPEAARDRANAFAEAAVQERRAEIRANIDAVLPQLQSDLATAGSTEARSLQSLIVQLTGIRASGNATLQVETKASKPDQASSPHTSLVLVAATVAGLALGLAAAFLLQVFDPRLRREEQLRALYGLPILTRIPRQRERSGPILLGDLTPPAREAYRTLRATLAATARDGQSPQSILVTGAEPLDGKTTTAVDLAASLALLGERVILIEANFRKPAIAKATGVAPPDGNGLVSVLLERVTLAEALAPVPDLNFEVLLAERSGAELAELLALPAAVRMLEDAMEIADHVIIDTPPLTDVVDALQLARDVDAVLLVARLGRSRVSRIRRLGELLAANGIRPVGFALIGVLDTGQGGRQGPARPRLRRPQRRERVASPGG